MRHHIQRSILDKLATSATKRYGEIKPPELDGNTFGYHLKAVINDRYVSKTENGSYQLTAKGKDYIVRRHEDPTRSAHSIYLIVVKNNSTYLLRERRVQPLLGYTGFVHGEPEPDLSIVESSQRRLFEKTGLNLELTIKGSALITQYLGKDLQSYSHAIILYGETSETAIVSGDATGVNSWGGLEDTPKLLPSCHDIVAMLENNQSWLEKSYQLHPEAT